ncbi:MAG: hypothetical protein R3Y61_04645 [Rikenellaceae bacterium]
MIFILIIIYAITLLYAATSERFRSYALIVGLQGWLLMAIALFQLNESSLFDQIFVVAETLLFKGLLIPYLLFRIIRKAHINRISYRAMPPFFSMLLCVATLVSSLAITAYVADTRINTIFFGVALFGILMGMILIMSRVKIFSHLVGFLLIENSVFLFSLAVGAHMPMLINVGILLDILMGVLMLGVFVTKISESLQSLDSEELTQLKD